MSPMITTAVGLRSASGAGLSWNGRALFRLSPRIFRDLLLVWFVPTTAALICVAVIAVERMQADPAPVTPQRVSTSVAWLAIALGFVLLHVAGSYIASLNAMTAREHAQRWATLVLVIGVGCLVMFGVPAGWSVPLPAELNRGLAIMFMLVYMSPILIFPVALLLFAVAALAFAVVLALATAPGVFRRETQAVVGRNFIAHIVVSPIALLIGVLGSFVAQTMYPSVGRIDGIADLITASSANGPYWPASIALFSCAIACTLICSATFLAREEPPPRVASMPTVGLVVAVQLAIVVALIWCAGALVHQRQTVFAMSGATRFPTLANYVRGGVPSLHEPAVASGRLFQGPFTAKRYTKVGVQGALMMVPQWNALVAIQFNPARKRRPLSCPSVSGELFQCRYIIVAANRPVDEFVVQREFVPRYFKHREERVWFEFSNPWPEAWLWRAERCWLHLENWPANGDLVQSEVDCNNDWVQQAARLREFLDQRFPRKS
jgi:hypothetical protein